MKTTCLAALLLLPILGASAAEVAPAPAKPAVHRLKKKDPCADKARAAAAKKQTPVTPARSKR